MVRLFVLLLLIVAVSTRLLPGRPKRSDWMDRAALSMAENNRMAQLAMIVWCPGGNAAAAYVAVAGRRQSRFDDEKDSPTSVLASRRMG